MEERQLTQPHPSVAHRAKRQPKKLDAIKVSRLVETYPLLFWGGIWVTVLLVAAIAIGGLLSPSLPGGRRASSAAFGNDPNAPVNTAQESGQVPVWVFGAIILSCTAGSILVSQRLTRSERGQRIARPIRQKQYRAVVSRPHASKKGHPGNKGKAPKRLKPFTDLDFSPLEALNALPTEPSHPAMSAANPPRARLKPMKPGKSTSKPKTRRSTPTTPPVPVAPVSVTVVPPEENHPLDWGEASLADTMDIRKRRSLSSWL